MATNDLWRFSVLGDWGGTNLGVVTFHVKFLSPSATPASASAALKAGFVDTVAPHFSNGFTWRQIVGASINLSPHEGSVYTTGFPISGSVSGDGLPTQIAMVVTFRTAYIGRSYRGRIYLPGGAESISSGTGWDSGTVSAVQTHFDDLVAAMGSSGTDTDHQIGVYSKKLASFTPITQALVRNIWGVQRRRRPGVGA